MICVIATEEEAGNIATPWSEAADSGVSDREEDQWPELAIALRHASAAPMRCTDTLRDIAPIGNSGTGKLPMPGAKIASRVRLPI